MPEITFGFGAPEKAMLIHSQIRELLTYGSMKSGMDMGHIVAETPKKQSLLEIDGNICFIAIDLHLLARMRNQRRYLSINSDLRMIVFGQ
jgi:hypothetical protein